ncbi:macrophage-capping protein [Histomonas meleagridis]|uniref:macrophage-capping protein n=1 Tax=Histomonas meleagridis TaxID=135588 RepID=UPI00355A0F12|nr:macrophage-capping protein [Histomonas meleagridis]KAH0796157.1 macrophage-capping protein [Histomonas meleagridis]
MDERYSLFSNTLSQNKSGTHVWRIENGKVLNVSNLGTFLTQFVYLILDVKYKMNQSSIYTIYLWCGTFSNPDDETPLNELIQVLHSLITPPASIHHEYEGYECEEFLKTFIPYGGVCHRTPGLEYVTKRGYSSLFRMNTTRVPHWDEVPACSSYLMSDDVLLLRTRDSFMLWLGSNSLYNSQIRAAELCGAFRASTGRDDQIQLVHEGVDDSDFIRYLSSSIISTPKRAGIIFEKEGNKKEIYQVDMDGTKIEFHLVVTGNASRLSACSEENAYILCDNDSVYVWFGKNQPKKAMGFGIVIGIVFMSKMNITRNVHIRVVRSGESFSKNWIA